MSPLPVPDCDWLSPFRYEARSHAQVAFLKVAFSRLTNEGAFAAWQQDLKTLFDNRMRSADCGREDADFDAAMTKALRDAFCCRLCELTKLTIIFSGAFQ
jgi:hypothetical protein